MPQYESRHQWLSLLLDCYALIDYSVDTSIARSKKKIACHKGCSACCYQTILLSTLEAVGIRFYVQAILTEESRTVLFNKYSEHKQVCLFNIDGSCIVYPLRPVSCRRYIVTSQCCKINEDPTITRPNDVLEPSREYLFTSIERTLPFYKSQNVCLSKDEHIFDFYKRQNVTLSAIYENILSK